GLSNAFWSFYWAFGVTCKLYIVGLWAVLSHLHSVVQTLGVLIGIVLVITAASVILVAAEYGMLVGRRFWRLVSWVGGVGLTLYGGIYAATAMTMLTGLVSPGAGYSKPVMYGHALLWEPLFFMWGLTLVNSLVLTRRSDSRQVQTG